GLLELAGPLRAQAVPRVGRLRDVLDGVRVARGVSRPKVERPQVHGVEGGVGLNVEGDTEEAFLQNVSTAHVELDLAVAEIERRPDQPHARPLVATDELAPTGVDDGGVTVDRSPIANDRLRLDGSLCADRTRREGERRQCDRDAKNRLRS